MITDYYCNVFAMNVSYPFIKISFHMRVLHKLVAVYSKLYQQEQAPHRRLCLHVVIFFFID